MYKILFVDDEQIVRDGIAHTIEWSTLGFEFVGAFENGVEADSAVDRLEPDVVITDICMPFRDGLELTEHLATKHPRIKVILLSGFDEFEYAQRAVRLGAYDYVLKPITAAELRSLLQRVRTDLDAEARKTAELQAMTETIERTRDTRIASITERIIKAAPAESPALDGEISASLQAAGVRLPEGSGVALVAAVDADNLLPSADLRPAGAPPLPAGTSFVDYDHRMVIIVSAETAGEAVRQARETARTITSRQVDSASRITVGVGGTFRGPLGFAQSYREAAYSLDYRYVAGLGGSIEYSEVPERARHLSGYSRIDGAEWSPQFGSALSDLSRAMHACDARECTAAVQALVAEMRRSFVSRAECTLQIHSILVNVNEMRGEMAEPPLSVDAFSKLPTLEDAGRLLQEACTSIIETQVKRGETYGTTKAREALVFIDQNYADPSLSLTSLCKAIAVSPSYFSAVFKSQTGTTFVAHLTEKRIYHAKQLLMTTDMRIYEIARNVGYRDEHYFCTIFKKSSGRSPMEFRRGAAAAEL